MTGNDAVVSEGGGRERDGGGHLHHVTFQHLGRVAAPSVEDVVIVPDHEARDAREGIAVVVPTKMLAIMAEIKLLDLGLQAVEGAGWIRDVNN